MQSSILAALAIAAIVPAQVERPIDQKLFDAVRQGTVSEVRALLAQGANPNAVEAGDWYPLTTLEGTPQQALAIAKLLIAKGAKVNARGPGQGYTALTHAVSYGEELVAYLLSKGADPRIPLTDGTTALHLAVGRGSVETVRLLLAHGASVRARTNDSQTVYPGRGQQTFFGSSQDKASGDALDHSFEPGFRTSGVTPYMSLAGKWDPTIAELLHKAGAGPKETDDNGWTALHYAVKYGNAQAIRGLIANGANVNASSYAGYRPLHIAMRVGFGFPSEEIVRLLLSNGADRNAKNKAGRTPLDLLRDDAEWSLVTLASDPSRTITGTDRQRYLTIVNAVAKALNPNAAPIRPKVAATGPKGRAYAPIDIADTTLDRKVMRVGGKAVLVLEFKNPPADPTQVTIDTLMLQRFEPSTPLPLRIELRPNTPQIVRVEFPPEAAEGGALSLHYRCTAGDHSSGEGSIDEMSPGDPSLQFDKTPTGIRVSVVNDIEGRIMLFHVDEVEVSNRAVATLAGSELTVKPNHPTPIPGLLIPRGKGGKQVSWHIAYRSRLLPNRTWRKGQMDDRM